MHERIAAMQPDVARVDLEWVRDTRPPLPCAICNEPMESLRLFQIAAERCRPHGVWFDKDQLAHVLMRSAQPPPPPRTSSSIAPDVALVAADAGAEVTLGSVGLVVEVVSSGTVEVAAEGAAGVAGAVVEMIGDIVSAILP